MPDHNTETIKRIGPFHINEEIGRGAMGVVYRAWDPLIGREVAIKTMYAPRLGEESQIAEARQRFALEAQAAGRMSHPNIVVIYQFGQERDFEYIAMELVPGSSLDRLMAAGRVWTHAEVASIIGQTAAALDFAHANQVVHRDIKPANIMLRPDGVVKVTDFGISRVEKQVLTVAGNWGTPIYMAPERLQGERGEAPVDQYALAVVAYQLLANRLPFGQTGDLALLARILQNEPDRLPDANQDAVIQRALSKDPAQRFATCTQFSEALQEALTAPEVFTKRTVLPVALSPIPVTKRTRRVWPVFVLLIALLTAAAIGVAWFVLHQPAAGPRTRGTTSETPETPASPKRVPVRTDAAVIREVMAKRPFMAKLERVKGSVQFTATVGADGIPRDFVLLSGPKKLESAAMKAAAEWRYRPATVDGEPVEQQVNLTVEFQP
jgi:tRNA A-37 threonylcarbamoyl transferase component Bud32